MVARVDSAAEAEFDAQQMSQSADDSTRSTVNGSPPGPADSHATELRTFLIADVRGYTKYTAEQGDEAAAALVDRFADIVREVVPARDGFLLELRGDEALVVFVSARQALRAAIDLQARFVAELPRGVGIGLDAGEAIPVGDGYRGSALNLAARLCARAAAGETLASEAVIHLAARVEGIAYVDARSFKIKGFDETVRAVVVLPSDRAAGRRRTSGHGGRPIDRRLVGAGVAGIVIVAIVAGALGAGFGGRAGPTAGPSGSGGSGAVALASPSPQSKLAAELSGTKLPVVALVDQKTGDLLHSEPIGQPTDIGVYGGGSFWQIALDPPSIHQIDASTGVVVRTIPSPVPNISAARISIDETGRSLWIGDPTAPRIVRIDTQTGSVADDFHITVPGTPEWSVTDVVPAAGSLWVLSQDLQAVLQVDPATGHVFDRLSGVFPADMVADGNRLWILQPWGDVIPLDLTTNVLPDTFCNKGHCDIARLPDDQYAAVVAGGGYVWTAGKQKGVAYRIDPGLHPEPFQTGPGAGAVSFADGSLFVANEGTSTVTAIDAATGAISSYDTGRSVGGVTAGGGHVLIVVNQVSDPLAGLTGKTLSMAVAHNPIGTVDPPAARTQEEKQVLRATCANLLAYPPQAAPGGWNLGPEVAIAPPDVSGDRLTYTFTVRSGFKFSPPSNESVTAETFRHSIERALAADTKISDANTYLGDISGVAAYRKGTTKNIAGHIAGLKVNGNQLSITLAAPSSTFLERLSLPLFCPVPSDTPPVGQLNDPVQLASAGPYYVSRSDSASVILSRNPNYSGSRTTPSTGFDNIAILEGQDAPGAIERVRNGTLGYVLSYEDESLKPNGDLARQWGPGSAAAKSGDQRYFAGPLPGTDWLALNPHRPLLGDPDVRKAIGLMVDRRGIADVLRDLPNDQLLPPVVPGHADRPLRPFGGADVGAAKALMAGRSGTLNMFTCPGCTGSLDVLTSSLATIGLRIDATAHDDPGQAAAAAGSEADILQGGTGTDVPITLTFLDTFAHDIPSQWLPGYFASELKRIRNLSPAESAAAAAALAERLVNDGYVIPIGGPSSREFFSGSIGCQVLPPTSYGVDLASLCQN